MARSRRRTISRQSGSPSIFSTATIAKWGLIALGASGGTYGVFRVVNMIPYGAAAVTDGTEVGPHLAEAASTAKPALPDDEGVSFSSPPRSTPNRVANHILPVELDGGGNFSSNLAGQVPQSPATTTEDKDPPPRPAGLPTGPNVPALPSNLGNNPDRNASNGLAVANGGGNPSGASLGAPALPERSLNPTNPLAQGAAPALLPSPSGGQPPSETPSPMSGTPNPSGAGSTGASSSLAGEASTTPISPSPNPSPNPLSSPIRPPDGALSSSDPAMAGRNSEAAPPLVTPPTGMPPTGLPATGLSAAGLSPPRPINPVANPLANAGGANAGATNPADLGANNAGATLPDGSRPVGMPPGSGLGASPSVGPTSPNPALLGGPPSSPGGLSPPGSNPISSNPPPPNPSPSNLGMPNALPPGMSAAAGALSSAATNGLADGSSGNSLAGSNPATPVGGPASPNPNLNPAASLPNTRPTIGIPQEDRFAGSPSFSPNPAGSPSNPTGSIPRSGSTSLPMADPMATDPRRTPAAAASYGNPPGINNPPNYNPAPDRTARESSVAGGSGGPLRTPASFVSNRPGDPQWEIQQQASLVVEKLAPPTVQVNVPAKFLMVVRNVGRVSAGQVLIRDRVPEKAQLLQATPKPTRQDGDLLEWELPALAAGDAFQIQLDLLPIEPGEIGSVAQVTSSTVAATRTRSTRPQLSVQHTGPPQAMVGQTLMMNIVVRNDGDGVAENVILREIVPPQLMHPAGNEIENPIGTLAPGQTRTLQLPLVAKTPGTARNTIRVSGDGKLSGEHSIDIQIVAPQLQVSAEGPERRFLSRSATHTFQVINNGSANATNVQMMAKLPQGLRYESSSPEGRYDPSRHAVFWAMANLPSSANQQVSLTIMPMAPGNQSIEFQALADLNQPQVTTKALMVEQLSELFFDIDDLQDPIEIGTNTMYVIRVENQGSQVANDVAIVVDIPEGIEPLNVESPVEYQMQRDGQNYRLVLAPIANMNPRAQLVIRVEARGNRDGDHRVEVRMTSAQRPTPVAKQESTKVYRDR